MMGGMGDTTPVGLRFEYRGFTLARIDDGPNRSFINCRTFVFDTPFSAQWSYTLAAKVEPIAKIVRSKIDRAIRQREEVAMQRDCMAICHL